MVEAREGMGGATEYQVGAIELTIQGRQIEDVPLLESVDDLREEILRAQGD